MSIMSIAKSVGINTGYFLFGFIVGTLIDLVFALIYKKIDPDREKYSTRVILVLVLQLLVIVGVLATLLTFKKQQTEEASTNTFMMHFGFITSQFYLMDYISKYIGSLLMRYPDKFPERPVRDLKRL